MTVQNSSAPYENIARSNSDPNSLVSFLSIKCKWFIIAFCVVAIELVIFCFDNVQIAYAAQPTPDQLAMLAVKYTSCADVRNAAAGATRAEGRARLVIALNSLRSGGLLAGGESTVNRFLRQYDLNFKSGARLIGGPDYS